jgi:putative heme-binding domain-containing protein
VGPHLHLPAADLDAALVRQLRLRDHPAINRVLAEKWGVVQTSSDDAAAVMEKWKTELTEERILAADVLKGKEVYARTCASCHVLFNEGGHLGPELTGSNRADLDYLLANIVDPNATIGQDYRLTIVATHDGRNAAGIVKRETPASATLANAVETITFNRDDIMSIERLDMSLMPPGLLESLTPQEVADLVAYLRAPGAGAP